VIRNSTRPNIEKLIGGFKMGKKIMAGVKTFQTMIENEILKINIRVFILI
jgi:hypothetical protein